ncbi:proline-rich receptor-like protein kinase PERK3 [Zingiber officinale]|uniref:proline-rich receptor-like protein kinase PERK3 n=1 Tax=Zingiber officinale TaxID=94328 RepID=UPI001C4CAB0B|nr:proline-rich receptor-like protein kinase PERK3 [Zingiber officinale]XP_042440027.1 proline-rich receptor-like protein kinase PERK3 [Zingiber officinale]
MPYWLRYLGFTASLPFALVASCLSMVFTVLGLFLMFIVWTFSFCTSCCCRYEKMREVVKTLNSIHFYIIGWCSCDPSWSCETVTENPTDLENPQPSPRGTRSFTYEELAISTNNFSMDNVLGEGGFSLVYKGTLTDGTKVAIKRLKDTHRQPDLEFMKEADILSLVHHRHLVSLIGFYVSELICLLVCEYVPNKTLEFHLHGRNGPTLAWKHRFRISLDSAKGLEYLHEHCNPRVIHRDIKAANILLDDQFRAKIADFGIAKHFSDEKTHISTVVKGTYGYLAPEYASSGQLTDKSDVYSYGVLLLELITGRRPLGLADWARPLLQQAMENGVYDALIDPSLEKNYSPVEAGTMVACASACLNRAAALRPSMSQIRRELEEYISFGDRNTVQSPPGSSSATTLLQS